MDIKFIKTLYLSMMSSLMLSWGHGMRGGQEIQR